MYSATMNEDMRTICKKFMNNPFEVIINDQSKLRLHGLQQYYIKLTEKEKNHKLHDLIDNLQFNQVIIFVSSCERAKVLNSVLNQSGFPSISIHAGVKQKER